MTKKEWDSLERGDRIISKYFYANLSSAPDDKLLKYVILNSVNNGVYSLEEASHTIKDLEKALSTDKLWTQFNVLKSSNIKKGTFGYTIGEGLPIYVASNPPYQHNMVNCIDGNLASLMVPREIIVPHAPEIVNFRANKFRLGNREIIEELNDAACAWTSTSGKNRVLAELATRKTVMISDVRTVKKETILTGILKDIVEKNVAYDGSNAIIHLIRLALPSASYIYCLPSQLEMIVYVNKPLLVNSTVRYIGRDYTKLKNGDICKVINVMQDYSNKELNAVTIINQKNKYQTMVFQKTLKLVK